MSIQDWGAIGEVVGAIAVLVTLVYLAKQIKHSSEVAMLSVLQARPGPLSQELFELVETRSRLIGKTDG